MKMEGTHVRNQAPKTFNQIRFDILRCHLEPGARLPLEELRERYSVGFSPLREALMRLEAEGLVVLEPNKGFRVSPVSKEHLLDLTRIRIEIECLAVRWSIEQGDVSWEADLVSAFHRLSRQVKLNPENPKVISERWHLEHRRFHSALVAACDSEILMSIHSGLFDQAERYVALSVAYYEKPRDDVAEHNAIMEASLARDVERACVLCTQHIRMTADKVLEYVNLSSINARSRSTRSRTVATLE